MFDQMVAFRMGTARPSPLMDVHAYRRPGAAVSRDWATRTHDDNCQKQCHTQNPNRFSKPQHHHTLHSTCL